MGVSLGHSSFVVMVAFYFRLGALLEVDCHLAILKGQRRSGPKKKKDIGGRKTYAI